MAGLDALDDEAVLAVYADESRPAGDREAAFHALVVRYRRRVFGICIRVLGSPQDAEDAVQETFLKLARHAGTFRGEAKLSTWLYRVAHNASTDRIRHEARRPSTPVDDLTTVGEEPVADDVLGARTTALSVRAALDQLDQQTRTLLLLVAVDGWTYQDVAAAVGLPVGTVKSRVSRARVRLGELLREADEAEPSTPTERAAPGRVHPSRRVEPRGPPG